MKLRSILASMCTVILLGLIFIAETPVSAAANLIPNSDFEASSGGLPTGWVKGGWGSNTRVHTYPAAGVSGSKAGSVTVSDYMSGDAKWAFTPRVSVTAGTQYTYSDTYASDIPTIIDVEFQMSDGTFKYIDIATLPAASSLTAMTPATFTTPAGAVAATVFHLIQANGTLTIDNASLEKTADAPPPTPAPSGDNLVPNGDFEIGTSVPSGWAKGGWGTNARSFSYPVAGNSSTKAAKVMISSYSSGDAKWFFTPDIAATPGRQYTYTSDQMGTVSSIVDVRFKMSDGTFKYIDITTIPVSSSWQTKNASFTAPAGAVSMTAFQLIQSVGSLTIDNVSIKETASTPPPPTGGTVPNGNLETASSGNPNMPQSWFKGGYGANTASYSYPAGGDNGSKGIMVRVTSYSSGDAKWYFDPIPVTPGDEYTFADRYNASVQSDITLDYTMANGSHAYYALDNLPATAGSWKSFSTTITVPDGATKMTVFHGISRVGSLTTDTYTLTKLSSGAFSQGMVSLSFDDGIISQYQNAVPVLNAAGIKSSFYIITKTFGDPDYLSEAQVKTLSSQGHEIGPHTRTHAHLTSLTESQMRDEIAGSKADLAALGATPNDVLVYPFGEYNDTVIAVAKQAGIIGARTVNYGFNTKNTDPFRLYDQHVESHVTLAQLKTWIDQAAANKHWLILEIHDVKDGGGQYSTTPATLKALVDYIKQKGIKTVTVDQGIRLMR